MSIVRPDRPLWQPTALVEIIKSADSSTGATLAKTDATFAYIKVLGNRSGPHRLACEWIGTGLARWFGLDVPDFAVFELGADDVFELPRGHRALPGPAFASRFVKGHTWGGEDSELRLLENPEAVTRMMVFDTWILNRDRHPPDLATRKPNYANVYLADTSRSNRWRLTAIDHTHCLTGDDHLSERVNRIDAVKDERAYGLFPGFRPLLDAGQLHWCKALLRSLERPTVERLVGSVPGRWDVDARAREALIELVYRRAGFVADMIDAGWPSAATPGVP